MSECSQTDPAEEVRALLSERGDSGSVPRPTSFFFYGGRFDELGVAAARAGYLVQHTVNNDGVVLEIQSAVDEKSFSRLTATMEQWAEDFGCQYDGWECQVITQ
jgi:hypothetical protein